jgi:flagellar hook-associated protein 3 FlgL
MTVAPISSGQIPNSLIASQFEYNLNSVMDQLNTVEQEVETGQQLTTPGQNPTATAIVLPLQQQLASQTQYQANLTTDASLLQNTGSALQNVSSAISQANSLLLSGLGTTSTSTDNQALAEQVESVIQGLVSTANSSFDGQYLFGGSDTQNPPFTVLASGAIRYNGDSASINSNLDSGLVASNNVSGVTAFGAISTPVGSDVDPALTLQTDLSDLNNGQGVSPGSIQVTVDSGSTPETETVNLSQAKTIGDVQQLIENAFPPGTLSVGVVSGVPQDALQITPASGTVAISDIDGGQTAADLGIASAATTSITGSDLNPQLTLETPLSALNGGAGVDMTDGITIDDGPTQTTVNISSDVTVQDLFNTLTAADPNLDVGINAAGNGLAISTRLSGVDFSIGENGGTTATGLGIRTMTGSTLLSSLNLGQGVPLSTTDSNGNPVTPEITIDLRDGSSVNVNLAGATTVQDVLNDINAVQPGVLTASLNSVGNGISITDNDGSSTGPLTVETNAISTALGIAGTQSSTDPTQPLVGTNVNPIQANGIFNLLTQLQSALSTSSNTELSQLQPLLQQELNNFGVVQANVGSQQQMISGLQSELTTQQTNVQSALSDQMNVNMASALTQLTQLQTSLQATLQSTASTMQMSIYNYL